MNPVVWRDILVNNEAVLLQAADGLAEETKTLLVLLEQEDGDGIEAAFRTRDNFAASCRNAAKA